jgi:uncharacterized membrane protein YoaT (DUF817 family)
MGFIVENVVTFISAAAYCCHSSSQMCPRLIQTLEKISLFSWECFHANSVFLFLLGGRIFTIFRNKTSSYRYPKKVIFLKAKICQILRK